MGIKQVAAAPCAAQQPRARVTSAKPRLIAPAGARRYRVPLSQRKMTTAKTALARGVEALKGPPPRPPRRPRPALQAAPLQSHTLQSHESPTTAPSSSSGGAAPQRDAEEFSITVHRVSLDELATIMTGGDMTPPSVVTAHMALAHLRKEGML